MQTNERLKKLTLFLKESPNDAFLQYAVATELLGLNRKEEALACYEGLVANHPDYIGTYYHLGKLYESLERDKDALHTYEAGIKAARTVRDMHALSELQAAYDLLSDW